MDGAEAVAETDIALTLRAASFATVAHAEQRRKYSGEPYVAHCFEVARLVDAVGGTPEMVAAAMLHDVVEDTAVTIANVAEQFGPVIARYVLWLTDVSKPTDGNRAARKKIDRDHLAAAPPEVKTIKLADLISNTQSIVEQDPGFAKVYLPEKIQLLAVLTEGDSGLWKMAKALAEEGVARSGL